MDMTATHSNRSLIPDPAHSDLPIPSHIRVLPTPVRPRLLGQGLYLQCAHKDHAPHHPSLGKYFNPVYPCLSPVLGNQPTCIITSNHSSPRSLLYRYPLNTYDHVPFKVLPMSYWFSSTDCKPRRRLPTYILQLTLPATTGTKGIKGVKSVNRTTPSGTPTADRVRHLAGPSSRVQ